MSLIHVVRSQHIRICFKFVLLLLKEKGGISFNSSLIKQIDYFSIIPINMLLVFYRF